MDKGLYLKLRRCKKKIKLKNELLIKKNLN